MRRSQSMRLFAGAVFAASLLAGPAAQAGARFLTYEGYDSVQQGRGGEKRLVDGVDVWVTGSPPHRFQILGTIDAGRRHGGLVGRIADSGLEGDVAGRARKAGGDAVILTDEVASKYLVVKYLPDSPDATPAYQPPPRAVLTARY